MENRQSIILVNKEDLNTRKKIEKKLNGILEDQLYIENKEDYLEVKFQVGTNPGRNKNGTEEEHKKWAEEMIYFSGMEEKKTEINFGEAIKKGKKLLHDNFYNKMPYDLLYQNLLIKKVPSSLSMFSHYLENELFFFKLKNPYKDRWRENFILEPTASKEIKEEIINNSNPTFYNQHKCNIYCKAYRLHSKQKEKGKIVFSDYLKKTIGYDDRFEWEYYADDKKYTVVFDSKEAHQVLPIQQRIFVQSNYSCDQYSKQEIRDFITEAVIKGREKGYETTDFNLICEGWEIVKTIVGGLSVINRVVNKEDFPKKILWKESTETYHFLITQIRKFVKYGNNQSKEIISQYDLEPLLEKMGAERVEYEDRINKKYEEWKIENKKLIEIKGGFNE